MIPFPLYFRDGAARFVVHLSDQGVALDGDTICWTSNGSPQVRNLSDISQVRLAVAPGGGRYVQQQIGHCELTFRDGRMLTVFGGSSLGLHDRAQALTYRRFVNDLHTRIRDTDHSRTVFFAGRARGQGPLSPVAIGFLAVVVVITAIVLVTQVGAIGLLGLAVLLGLMTLSFLPQMLTNSGKDYRPSAVPDRLTPH